MITKVDRTRAHIQCQIQSTADRALGMELGLVASLTRADVGGIIIINYTGASQTDHTLLIGLRHDTVGDTACRLKFYFITR